MESGPVTGKAILPKKWGASRPGGFPLKAVLACADVATGISGLTAIDDFCNGQGQHKPAGIQSIWRFELLNVAGLREIAATDAAAADLVVISTHAPGKPAAVVRQWIKAWFQARRGRQGKLLLLLDEARQNMPDLSPIEKYLKKLAGLGRMEFLIKRLASRTTSTPALTGAKPAWRGAKFHSCNRENGWSRNTITRVNVQNIKRLQQYGTGNIITNHQGHLSLHGQGRRRMRGLADWPERLT